MKKKWRPKLNKTSQDIFPYKIRMDNGKPRDSMQLSFDCQYNAEATWYLHAIMRNLDVHSNMSAVPRNYDSSICQCNACTSTDPKLSHEDQCKGIDKYTDH